MITEHLVAKKAVKSGSAQSYISFLVKDLLKLRATLGNTSFFHSVLESTPKKILAFKSVLTNLGNTANDSATALREDRCYRGKEMGTLRLIGKKNEIQKNPGHMHHLKVSVNSPGFPLTQPEETVEEG